MQLVEQGKLSLDAPIGQLLPDLASPQVLEGFDAKGEPKLRPAKGAITLRHLMTHTAGFCYNMWNGDMGTYLDKTGLPPITTCKNDALKTPLAFDPGDRWEYGINIDFAGKMVEKVSGERLEKLTASLQNTKRLIDSLARDGIRVVLHFVPEDHQIDDLPRQVQFNGLAAEYLPVNRPCPIGE